MELKCENRIKGRFKGWKKGNIYRLANNSRWEQIEQRYQTTNRFNPVAKVYSEGEKFYLEVEGFEGKVEVRRSY